LADVARDLIGGFAVLGEIASRAYLFSEGAVLLPAREARRSSNS